MKKKLLLFLAPALLLSLVGCGKKTSSPVSPVNTSPTSTTPKGDDTSTTPKPDVLTYTIPTDLAEMHEAVAKATKDDYVGFIAKIVGVQQYNNSSTVNLFLQNGKYGYRVNNVPASLELKVGDAVEVYGNGAAKSDYPAAINYKTNGKITVYSAGTVTAEPLAWSSSISISESCSAAVTGSGTVTAVGTAEVTVAIGSDSVTLLWKADTVGGAEVATKMAGVSIGQDVEFSGAFKEVSSNTIISILQADGITLVGEPNKQAWTGTLSQLEVGGITGQVNSGNTLALSGTAEYVNADIAGRYEKGYVVGAKLTKHESLTDLKSVTAKVTLPGFDGAASTVVEYTNEQLVEKKILVADGLEFYFNLTDKYKNAAIAIEVNWASYVETQTVTLAFGDITYETAPTLLEGTASLEGLNGTVNGNNITVGSAETPITIPWVADKGNVVTVKVTAPVGYVAEQTTVSVHKNGDASGEAVAWSTLNPASDAISLDLVPVKVTDTFIIEIVWKTGIPTQHIKVNLAEGTTLAANPVAPAEQTLTLAIATILSGTTDGTKVSNLPTGDENITIVASDAGNNGKYYTSDNTWRMYQGNNGTVTITALNGKTIVSVTITYTNKNSGVLKYNDTAATSGQKVDVNATSAVFSVGNTGSGTSGQAKITNISIVYA